MDPTPRYIQRSVQRPTIADFEIANLHYSNSEFPEVTHFSTGIPYFCIEKIVL